MRAFVAVVLVLGLLAPATSAAAQDALALRREMEQMRKQFEAMQEQYKKTLDSMAERLDRVEARPQPAATAAPATVQPAAAQPAPGAPPAIGLTAQRPPGSEPTALDLIRPRQPYALYERRGPGQLLFDMGVTGDFVGNLTQHNVQKNQGGSFPGLENLFFLREGEVSFFGQIDPYARAEVRIEAGQDQRGEGLTVSVAEANLTLTALPYGTQLKMGQMRNRFGYLNQIHAHDWPFIDNPNVLQQFFGKGGLVDAGFEATWVPPLPFYLELLGGVFNGQNNVAFGRDQISNPLVTGRLRTFFDLDDWGAIQLGSSVAAGQTPQQKSSTIVGFDAKYKYTPPGWQRAAFTLLGEYLLSFRDVVMTDADGFDGTRHRNSQGFYVGGELRPFNHGELSKWLLGFRYDRTQYPAASGTEWAVQPFLTYYPSEFLRFRLGYKQTTRSQCCRYLDFQDNGGSARQLSEYFLQATFIMGAHPADRF
ncbi:MAG TPA: hypothetical protein VGV06_07635 [Methylomirabilota bacterium]|nr:hypothetical protein [Methylomirabilota bacterium]